MIATNPPVLRGRDDELDALINPILDAMTSGAATLTVEGPAGIGRTRLLEEAAKVARRAGFVVFGLPDDRADWDELIMAIEHGPVLLSLDDAQAITAPAFAMLGWLLKRFAERPVVALAAFREPTSLGGSSASAYRQWVSQSAVPRARLAPLGPDAVAALVVDRHADASQHLLSVAAIAHGHPGLITELLNGNLLAGLTPGEVIANRLSRLPPRTRTALRCGAVLRDVFLADELGELTGLHGSELDECIQHGVHAALLVARSGVVRFRDPVIREAVAATVPSALAPLLIRRAVDVMLAHGAKPEDVASALAEVTEAGDRRALAILREATSRLKCSSPQRAATLGARALALDPRADNDAAFAGTVIDLLWRDGRATQARAVARQVSATGDPVLTATVELGIRRWSAHDLTPDSVAPAVSSAADLPAELKVRLIACHAMNAGLSASREAAVEAARSVETYALESADAVAEVMAQIAVVIRTHRQDLAQADRAIERANTLTSDHLRIADEIGALDFWRCVMLAARDRLTESRDQCEQTIARLEAATRPGEARAWRCLRASVLCELGRLHEAEDEAAAFLASAQPELVARDTLAAWMWLIRARIARHVGDARISEQAEAAATHLRASSSPGFRQVGELISALLTDATEGAPAGQIDPDITVLPVHSPTEDVTLVRIFLDRGHRAAAQAMADDLERRAAGSEVGSLRAAAMHARAVALTDPTDLTRAAQLFAASGRPLAEASCLEDHGRALADNNPEQAIRCLDAALAIYTAAGATRDTARVRARLRGLGAMRRLAAVGSGEPTGLTSTEQLVVEQLVAGCSDREIAERLYISAHTVRTHIRHVFAKLDVSSRIAIVTRASAWA